MPTRNILPLLVSRASSGSPAFPKLVKAKKPPPCPFVGTKAHTLEKSGTLPLSAKLTPPSRETAQPMNCGVAWIRGQLTRHSQLVSRYVSGPLTPYPGTPRFESTNATMTVLLKAMRLDSPCEFWSVSQSCSASLTRMLDCSHQSRSVN